MNRRRPASPPGFFSSQIPQGQASSKNSKANRMETGETSGGIWNSWDDAQAYVA